MNLSLFFPVEPDLITMLKRINHKTLVKSVNNNFGAGIATKQDAETYLMSNLKIEEYQPFISALYEETGKKGEKLHGKLFKTKAGYSDVNESIGKYLEKNNGKMLSEWFTLNHKPYNEIRLRDYNIVSNNEKVESIDLLFEIYNHKYVIFDGNPSRVDTLEIFECRIYTNLGIILFSGMAKHANKVKEIVNLIPYQVRFDESDKTMTERIQRDILDLDLTSAQLEILKEITRGNLTSKSIIVNGELDLRASISSSLENFENSAQYIEMVGTKSSTEAIRFACYIKGEKVTLMLDVDGNVNTFKEVTGEIVDGLVSYIYLVDSYKSRLISIDDRVRSFFHDSKYKKSQLAKQRKLNAINEEICLLIGEAQKLKGLAIECNDLVKSVVYNLLLEYATGKYPVPNEDELSSVTQFEQLRIIIVHYSIKNKLTLDESDISKIITHVIYELTTHKNVIELIKDI